MKEHMKEIERIVEGVMSCNQELQKLDQYAGLEEFKQTMQKIISSQKRQIIAYSRGKRVRKASCHMTFLGNPGTGKTEMSRQAARLLHKAGVVRTDKFTVAGRSDLVGEHVGETALKTKALLKRASGGVLLIDEAYSLLGDLYGDEAINTLVEEMESCREDLVLIFAGYPDRMRTFLSRNPGLQSRIPYTVCFSDYTEDQLYDIAVKFAVEDGYYFREDVRDTLCSLFRTARKNREFGNARYVRNLVEQAEALKADKVNLLNIMSMSDDDLFQLTPEDFPAITMVRDRVEEKRIGF